MLTRRLDGALLALFADKWRLNAIQRDNPSLRLDPLLAGTDRTPSRPGSADGAPGVQAGYFIRARSIWSKSP